MKLQERFEIVNGSVDAGDVTVYALSTCGFCRRALSFLQEKSVKFRFLYVDDLSSDEKAEIRKAIYEQFNRDIRYPFLIINNERCLVGFIEEEWKEMLGIK